MIATDALATLAVDAVADAAASVDAALRRGERDSAVLDDHATAAIAAHLSHGGPDHAFVVRGAEGERDGVAPLSTPPMSADAEPWAVYCDPIDGSSCAAGGDPRSVSVIALAPDRMNRRTLPDSTAVFCLGSHVIDASGAFDDAGALNRALSRVFCSGGGGSIGTLNRVDNRRLLTEHGRSEAARRGSERRSTASVEGDGWFAAGNTTVLLPLEVDTEIGRMGLVEAQIQSAMTPSWSGMVVSRDRLQDYPGGTTAYVYDLMRERAHPEDALARLFSTRERAMFRAAGWESETLLRPLTTESFGPGREAVIAIAGITGSRDDTLRTKRTTVASAVPTTGGATRIHVLRVQGGQIQEEFRNEHPSSEPRREGSA